MRSRGSWTVVEVIPAHRGQFFVSFRTNLLSKVCFLCKVFVGFVFGWSGWGEGQLTYAYLALAEMSGGWSNNKKANAQLLIPYQRRTKHCYN